MREGCSRDPAFVKRDAELDVGRSKPWCMWGILDEETMPRGRESCGVGIERATASSREFARNGCSETELSDNRNEGKRSN